MNQPLTIPQHELTTFCQKHHIQRLSFFGSILRDDFGPESDIDVLVEFDPDHVPGLLTLAGMEIELSKLLGRQVDLRLPGDLSRYFRQDVLNNAQVQYAHR